MKDFLVDIFINSVHAAHPSVCLRQFLEMSLPRPSDGKLYILSCGKASAAVAAVLDGFFSRVENRSLCPETMLAVVPLGSKIKSGLVQIMEASHPFPDKGSVLAAQSALTLASSAGKGDIIWVILSGGASALWCAPVPVLTLQDKRALTKDLLKSGATIEEINCVRKHVSLIKGGGLLKLAYPASVITTAISDVVGDDPAVIGSGPTVVDDSSLAQARSIIDYYKIKIPSELHDFLQNPAHETLKQDTQSTIIQAVSSYHILASGQTMLDQATVLLEQKGYEVFSLGDRVTGEAREIALDHARLVKKMIRERERSFVLLSGGELTVSVTGTGRGGSNQEYALALAIALEGESDVSALIVDSDGIDGGDGGKDTPAGAYINSSTLQRATALKLCPATFLENNDSGSFFELLGDLIMTGMTETNVNDFRLIIYDIG